MVEASDILACGGYLPEKYVGAASDGGREDEAPAPGAVEDEAAAALQDEVPTLGTVGSELEEAKQCVTDLNTGGVSEVSQEGLAEHGDRKCDEQVGDHAGEGSALVIREQPPTTTCGGTCPKREEGNAPNEANFGDDVCIVQPQDIIEVPTNSGGVSGLEGCQTNPILETKPISAAGVEAGGSGGSTARGRPLTESEQRDAWKEIRRREWHRARAEKEARERERLARLNGGVANAGTTSSPAGEAAPPRDVRGP